MSKPEMSWEESFHKNFSWINDLIEEDDSYESITQELEAFIRKAIAREIRKCSKLLKDSTELTTGAEYFVYTAIESRAAEIERGE